MKTRFMALALGTLSVLLVAGVSIFGRHGANYGEISAIKRNRSFEHYVPAGMVLVSGGTFTSGSYGNNHEHVGASNSTKSVQSAYWDRATISNSQYGEFLRYAEKNPNGSGKNKDEDEEEDGDDGEDEDDVSGNIKVEKDIYYKGVLVSPDKTSWRVIATQTDSAFITFLDILAEEYFKNPAYDSFPVVCISKAAAEKFADWRTEMLNDYRASENLPMLPPFRLPTADEYSYAARGGAAMPKYSFGGPYALSGQGDALMNFKAKRGSPNTGPSKCEGKGSSENGYGLYHMSGNVFSMTSTSKISKFSGDSLYCVMGGSWASAEACAQVGFMLFVKDDFRAPIIGFRCVMHASVQE